MRLEVGVGSEGGVGLGVIGWVGRPLFFRFGSCSLIKTFLSVKAQRPFVLYSPSGLTMVLSPDGLLRWLI